MKDEVIGSRKLLQNFMQSKEKAMKSKKKSADSSNDELLKTKKNDIELTESELGKASGGYFKVDGIEGPAGGDKRAG